MNSHETNSSNDLQSEETDCVGRTVDREYPVDNSWPKYSRHGNPSSPLHSNSSTPVFVKEGTPILAGTPTDFKIIPPYNTGSIKLRHYLRPDTSLPFDKDMKSNAEDFISELQGSFSRPPEGAFGREKAMRTRTALKMEGDQDMTSLMMEKYTDIPSNRVEPIKHHNTFIGFRDDSGNHAIGEYLHSTESILISNDTDTEDESEFEIPNGKINRLPETSSVGVQVNTFQNRRSPLETEFRQGHIRKKMHKNEGTWSLS